MATSVEIKQATEQALFTKSRLQAERLILTLLGVSVPVGTNVLVETKNGVTILTPPGGRSIAIPQDEYEAIVYAQQLEAISLNNRDTAYSEWVSANPQYGDTGSNASLVAFLGLDRENRNAGGPGFYVNPTIGDPLYEKAQQAKKRIAEQTVTNVEIPKAPILDLSALGKGSRSSPVSPAQSQLILQKSTKADLAVAISLQPTTLKKPIVAATDPKKDTPVTDKPNEKPDDPKTGSATITVTDLKDEALTKSGDSTLDPTFRTNPLNSYTSYTYNLSLHMLGKKDFNDLVKGIEPRPKHTLIASAGRGGSVGKRDKNWSENFFWDELKMNTVIGLNHNSQGTNAIDLSFVILEPMGMSLLDRLIQTTIDIGEKNHLSVPYLLQIDFYDSEQGLLKNLRKWIPIRLIECKIKGSVRGSEYRFRAVPFQHQAMMESVITTPANFEIVAGTIEEFFKKKEVVSTTATAREAVRGPAQRTTDNGPAAKSQYTVSSYVAAYNAWQEELTNNGSTGVGSSTGKAGTPGESKTAIKGKFNTIDVVFHPAITDNGGGKIINQQTQSSLATPMGTVGQSGAAAPPSIGTTMGKFYITAGTHLTQVIHNMMKNTEYVRQQITDGSTANKNPLSWYKIIPSIELNDYDTYNGKWSFAATYYVVPYEVKNSTHTLAPKYEVSPRDAVKVYDYLYTGKNVDVLDLQIDFDFLYYTAIIEYRGKTGIASGDRASIPQQENGTDPKDTQPTAENVTTTKTLPINPTRRDRHGDDVSQNGMGIRNDPRAQATESVSESLYSSSRGDMLNVRMKINGDPEFIKQDEIYVTPTAWISKNGSLKGYSVNPTDINGSLPMDSIEIMVQVNFRIPVDYDENTGGLAEGSNALSKFSGVYRILQVENIFKNGKFEQTLDMIRYHDQSSDIRSTANFRRETNNSIKPNTTNQAANDAVLTPTNVQVTSVDTGQTADEAREGGRLEKVIPETENLYDPVTTALIATFKKNPASLFALATTGEGDLIG